MPALTRYGSWIDRRLGHPADADYYENEARALGHFAERYARVLMQNGLQEQVQAIDLPSQKLRLTGTHREAVAYLHQLADIVAKLETLCGYDGDGAMQKELPTIRFIAPTLEYAAERYPAHGF